MRHPLWWTKAKLAIVFTYFFLLSFFLLFSFFFLHLLLFTHFGDTPEGKIDTEMIVQAHHLAHLVQNPTREQSVCNVATLHTDP